MVNKMDEQITVYQLTKEIKDIDVLLKDLRHERERIRIGFLDSETPRLMSLLTDTIEVFEASKAEWKDARKQLKHLKKEEKRLKESVEAAEIPPSLR